jgi:hypothetical protein
VTDAVLVDAVVCVAAEAMALSPQAVRPAVLAAFTRARDVGISAEAVVAALAPAPPVQTKAQEGTPPKAKDAKKSRAS